MISVDTNVIVRLLTGDDKAQFSKAKALFANENIVISTSVLLECEWVLRYAYQFKPTKIVEAFQTLFGLPNVKLQEHRVIYDAMQWHKNGLDFADAIHIAKSQDVDAFLTFDKKLVKAASRVTSLSVREP